MTARTSFPERLSLGVAVADLREMIEDSVFPSCAEKLAISLLTAYSCGTLTVEQAWCIIDMITYKNI
jgi:hypothetical protein